MPPEDNYKLYQVYNFEAGGEKKGSDSLHFSDPGEKNMKISLDIFDLWK